MDCAHCQKQTVNPKFCSRSCAVTHNNSKTPKRKRKQSVCVGCKREFYRNAQCQIYCALTCKRKTRLARIKTAGRFDIDGTPASPTVRKYITEFDGNRCAVCALSGENWRGKRLTLIVDHIDGDACNWAIENMQLVCPNCDSQLPTFKGRNKGKSTRKYTITQK